MTVIQLGHAITRALINARADGEMSDPQDDMLVIVEGIGDRIDRVDYIKEHPILGTSCAFRPVIVITLAP